ncbi:hypothetical protein [Conexibacter arvalis]|uniref:Uncharacterized protein n=1 Tax=Conexibacter arvalis TaxID=912552 RepID=A0A840IFF3_9ACTN|nr:hypothetical protein [Conexibacter arvalis]MBB4662794.1 hypothetical protein [Conexibacter arvalis]
MTLRGTVLAALAAMIAAGVGAAAAGAASDPGVRLTAAFPRDARLGAETPVAVGLKIAPRHLPAPVEELRLRFPDTLGIATSGLGAATCSRPAADFEKVMIAAVRLAGCSPNAVMGRGTARAEVRLGGHDRASSLVIPELANVTMLAAPFRADRFGLLFLANGQRPFGVTLAFAGEIGPAPRPFGGSLVMRVPPVPNQFDAVVALTQIAFEIGARDIRYRRGSGARASWYRPEGIVLPRRCPRAGFRFELELRLADGRRPRASAVAPCPRPATG